MTTTLRDQFGRGIEYLRISITDRCNFRCLYCMPAEGLEWLPKQEILTYEEIASVTEQSMAAVKTQLFRGKGLLAGILQAPELGLGTE